MLAGERFAKCCNNLWRIISLFNNEQKKIPRDTIFIASSYMANLLELNLTFENYKNNHLHFSKFFFLIIEI